MLKKCEKLQDRLASKGMGDAVDAIMCGRSEDVPQEVFATGKPLKYERPGRSYIFGIRPLYVFLIGLAGLKSYIHILLAVYFNGFPV